MQIEKPSDLARIVKTRRQAQNFTQQDVADAAGITRQSLARIERGYAGASFDTVLRIFEKLGIRLEAAVTAQHPLDDSISADSKTHSPSPSLLAAAAGSRNADASALTAAAAAAASRNIDASALTAAVRNIDASALTAAVRNIDASALTAAAAAATATATAASRNIDSSALLTSWRTALDKLTVQVREAAASAGTDIGAGEARKALLSAAIEAGDPDHGHSTTDGGLDSNKISDRNSNG
jgi:transcriptional regulator with XRE-family HTH domain